MDNDPTAPGPSNRQRRDPPPPHHRPPNNYANWPSIKIVRPPQGLHSPRTDERCITYCSQSVGGRTNHRPPWCRSFCIRRVFAHEVQSVLAAADSRRSPTHHPLPPEFQALSSGDSAHEEDVRYWEEGWYVWIGQNHAAAIERLMLMRGSLRWQADWYPVKRRMLEDARRKRDAAQGGAHVPQPPSPPPARPMADDPSSSSTLVHLRPAFPSLGPALAPTGKLLALVRESLASGEQWRLAGRLWEKASSPEPFMLARNVCRRVWTVWRGPPAES